MINALWHQRLGHLSSSSLIKRLVAKVESDQRLMASKVGTLSNCRIIKLLQNVINALWHQRLGHYDTANGLFDLMEVINALWHQRLGHIFTMCDGVSTCRVINALWHQRLGHITLSILGQSFCSSNQRLMASKVGTQGIETHDLQDYLAVINALWHQRLGHITYAENLSVD